MCAAQMIDGPYPHAKASSLLIHTLLHTPTSLPINKTRFVLAILHPLHCHAYVRHHILLARCVHAMMWQCVVARESKGREGRDQDVASAAFGSPAHAPFRPPPVPRPADAPTWNQRGFGSCSGGCSMAVFYGIQFWILDWGWGRNGFFWREREREESFEVTRTRELWVVK